VAVENLNCNQCGANLEVGASVNFVTCARCGAALVVRRTGTSSYTEVVEKQTDIAAGPRPTSSRYFEVETAEFKDELVRQNALNRLENQLNRLDINWEREKEQYMLAGRYGHRYIPTAGLSVVGGLAIAIFGTFWTIFAFGITSGFTWSLDGDHFGPPIIVRIIFPLFGVFFVIFGVWNCMHAYNKALAYERAHRAYQDERARLQQLIFDARGGERRNR
jgi:hypothetical protein